MAERDDVGKEEAEIRALIAAQLKAEEPDEDEGPADEFLSRAHDALFTGDVDAAERECRAAIAAAPNERDAYVLLNMVARQRRDLESAAETCREWGRNCGESSKQLLSLAEACYLMDSQREAADVGKAMAAYRPKVNEAMALYSKVLVAAMLSDFPELGDVTESVLSSCEGVDVDEDFADLIDALCAWADRRTKTDASLQTLARIAEKTGSEFDADIANLARALGFLHTLETKGSAACKEELPKVAAGNVDANMCAVLSLAAFADGDKDDAKELAEIALNGANVLFAKRLAKIL